jgi:hypothetical protein
MGSSRKDSLNFGGFSSFVMSFACFLVRMRGSVLEI